MGTAKLAKTEGKSAFARRLGVSPAYVTKLIGKGLPVTEDGSQVKVAEALEWIRANINARSDGGRNQALPSDLNEAKIRLTLANAARVEHALQVERGKYIDRDEARRAVRAFSRGTRDLMLNFANRYGAGIAAELRCEPATVMAVIDKRMREMLLEGMAVPASFLDPSEAHGGDSAERIN